MIRKVIGGIHELRGLNRSLHHKQNPKNYPQVNINDVVLDKPRYGFRKKREPLLSQSVTDTLFPSESIKLEYKKAGKPVPIKHRGRNDFVSRRNLARFNDEIATGEPHFKVGKNKVYFPKGRVCLLRPNAKHTPYQAKFLVPRNFNKMDLRDYLWHLYGLRALNVTVQLLHAKFTRGWNDLARYRGPQFKKMTIDMAEPFVWPELPPDANSFSSITDDQREIIQVKNSAGSNKNKPIKAFDGLYNKPTVPNKFMTKNFKRKAESNMKLYNEQVALKDDKALVNNYLGY